MERKNKIDSSIEKSANMIDRGIEEIIGSKYLKLIFKACLSVVVSVGSGILGWIVVYELSAQEKYFEHLNGVYTSHNEPAAHIASFVIGLIMLLVTWKFLNRK